MRWRGAWLWPCMLAGCLLDADRPERHLSAPTVVAIEAEPPEAAPGERVRVRAVVASPAGPVEEGAGRWSFCRTPRALSESGAISVACATQEELPQSARVLEVELTMPDDACARFGPETAAGVRPTDPDPSGGYYQPLRFALPGARVTVQRLRVRCALANAPLAIVQDFALRYHGNRAPVPQGLRLAHDETRAIARQQAQLRLELDPEAREHYLVYEPTRGLVDREETLSVSWYVSAGELAESASFVMGDHASVSWTAPDQPGTAWAWAVLRDDRGGLGTALLEIEVER